jgi:hypothetical protein
MLLLASKGRLPRKAMTLIRVQRIAKDPPDLLKLRALRPSKGIRKDLSRPVTTRSNAMVRIRQTKALSSAPRPPGCLNNKTPGRRDSAAREVNQPAQTSKP